MGLPDRIADFHVLSLLYGKSTRHILYLREHNTRPASGELVPFPNGRTLFLVNIPPDATERELTLFFKPCGHVERVVIQQDVWSPEGYGPLEDNKDEGEGDEIREASKEAAVTNDSDDSAHPRKKLKSSKKKQKKKGSPPQVIPLPQPQFPLRTLHHSGSSAHVVFTDSVSISRALALSVTSSDQRIWPPTTGPIAPSGLAHYVELHKAQRPSLPDVKTHADTFLEVYEYNKALTKQEFKYKKGEAIVDEDGFTQVTRGGAYGTTLGGGVGVASKQFMKDMTSGKQSKKKNKKHEKDNFYRFQIHEKKRKGSYSQTTLILLYSRPGVAELVDLKVEFEKDKEKIARLRESRRFKPY